MLTTTTQALPAITLYRDIVDNSICQASITLGGVELAADCLGRLALAANGDAADITPRQLRGLRTAADAAQLGLSLSAQQVAALRQLVQPATITALQRAARG